MNTSVANKIGRSVFAIVSAFAAVALPIAATHAEDFALCVGVNHYPSLRPGANLNGCINDANLFANKMGALGIRNLKILTDTTATKAGILGQLSSLKGKLHPGDRFVFYFAGHGTTSGQDEAVFLPSDARDDSEKNDMKVRDLYEAVNSLGAGVHKTIVLDSCHSGGMVPLESRGWHPSGHKLRPRLYVRTSRLNQKAHGFRTVKRWQEVDNNGADDLSATVGAANNPATGAPASGGTDKEKICYFTAAKQNEAANETEVGGEEHGLFTYYLVNALKNKKDPWSKVESDVSSKVSDATDNAQTPALHPNAELGAVAFGAGTASPASGTPTADPATTQPAAQTMTMKDVYCVSVPNPDALVLKRFPEQGPIAIGSKNYFEVSIKHDGFLVLIARDPVGNLDIMYPRTPADMDSIAVHAGDTIRLPKEGKSFSPDTAGPDGVQAILFAHAEDAQAMLKPFLPGSANDAASGASRGYRTRKTRDAKHDWDEEPIPSAQTAASTEAAPATAAPVAATLPPFFTSEVTTLIVPRDEATP